ncbi:MAG: Cj0069 family protein [Phenylobacterium sp.]
MAKQESYRVAVVWRGDRPARAAASPGRFKAVFEALARRGIAAEPAVFCEAVAGEVRDQLLAVDGVLVWVDPLSAGLTRRTLDPLLREAADAGVVVSAHPDVIRKMGTKAVLYRTRDLGWGTDTHLYETPQAFAAQFPDRLAASGPRVLKQNRGNGGEGVWKVEPAGQGLVRVQEANGEVEPRILPLADFMASCAAYFADGGRLVDQAFQARLMEGMIRCYMSGDRVVGFGHQLVRALAPPEAGAAGPRLYSGPDDARFQRLRAVMEGEWTPAMARLLEIDPGDLPVIWDADFLLGPKTADGADSHVLCEINASSVFPIPEQAPDALARTVANRLAAAAPRRLTVAPRTTGDHHA